MGRGNKIGFKCSTRRRAGVADKGSDGSDEDYTVGEGEELDESEDEYASSFDGEESEEILDELDEEEEEEEEFIEKKGKRVGRPRNGIRRRKTNRVVKLKRNRQISYGKKVMDDSDDSDEYMGTRRNGVQGQRKKRRVSYQESDDDYDESNEHEDDKRDEVTKPSKEKGVSYKEDDDEDYDDSHDDDDDDEEFTPDEIDNDVDDEDSMMDTMKNKKLGRPRKQEKKITKDYKRKKPKVLKKNRTKGFEKNTELMVKARLMNHVKIRGGKARVEEKKINIKAQGGRRRRTIESDSDFECSGLSDYEYTISEEEREQVREANEFCRNLITSLRSSAPVKKLQVEQESVQSEIKCPGRKGKEKEEYVKIETGKQVCGICLSEEEKRTVRGKLNCCSHYFCFTCIMEWSKVESRCPLCKQRFVTISKSARSHTEFDLRTGVIQVPERDQVYQPSDEELRGYLDPYESVICTECHQGGDDALMLLCDLCDSPAHTYCVGLGHDVPEGNWYCEGCRPTALDPSSPRGLNPTPENRMVNNLSEGSSPVAPLRETFDLNEAYVPDTPLTQGMGQPSPRLSVGDFQAASPASGSAALTVLERRRIQYQIRQIFNIRRRQDSETNSTLPAVTANNLLRNEVSQARNLASQQTLIPERRIASDNLYFEGNLQGNITNGFYSSNSVQPRFSHFGGPVIQSQASTSTSTSFGRFLPNEYAGISTRSNSGLGLQQVHPCSSRSNIAPDSNSSPLQCREVSPFNVEKEQLQSLVRSHLKSLSRDLDLGYSTFNDIARSSTQTILAACGLEHQQSEVYPMQTPLVCLHVERVAGSETCATKAYCPSCLDSLISDVVREITKSKVTLVSKD